MIHPVRCVKHGTLFDFHKSTRKYEWMEIIHTSELKDEGWN